MDQTTIKLGGVPEHFNLPIHLAVERGDFASRGVDLQWTTYSGGTGQMTAALRSGEIDACILLTEGIIKDVYKGNDSKIISVYVSTPLTWGVHTGAASSIRSYDQVYDGNYAISRYGSGSHLMAIVDADEHGHTIGAEQWQVVGNLDGALASLESGDTEVFYWEKYTTKPYVDQGLLRRVGEYKTPWPCFVIAARQEVLDEQPEAIIRMLRTIHDSCDTFMQQEEQMIALVAERYLLESTDVARWYHSTEWAIHGWVSDKMIKSVVYHLMAAGIIERAAPYPDLIWKR